MSVGIPGQNAGAILVYLTYNISDLESVPCTLYEAFSGTAASGSKSSS